ncbi:MAG: hypothetical protein J1E29_00890 [Duncaniella sp.]|nr:hypothetical protein [Duncaniella sp.]
MRRLLLTLSLALVAVLSALAGDKYQLVTDASTLKVGDQIIIVNNGQTYALGTTQNSSNRKAVSVDVKDNIVEASDDVQVITLAESTASGYPFLLKVGENDYLYSSSTNSNQLKTITTTNPAETNGTSVNITNNGIVCNQENRNALLYNVNSNANSINPIFSYYASSSATGGAIQISRVYKLVAEVETPDTDDPIDTDDSDDPKGDARIQIFNNGLGFPEGSAKVPTTPTEYTATDTNITYEIMGCYTTNGYLMVNGKNYEGAYISFALPYNCTALSLTTTGSCSENDLNTVNIYAGDTKIADNYKVNIQSNTYVVEIPAELQAAGTVYKVESNTTKYNAQFASFTYYGKTNSPEEPETQVATPVVSVEEGADVYVGTTVTISCATEGALFNGYIEFEEAEQIDLEDEPLPYTFTLTDEMIGLVSITGWATKEGLEDSEELEDYMFNVVEAPETPQTVTATVIMKDQEDLTYGKDKTITWVSQDKALEFSTIATITGNTYPTKTSEKDGNNLRIYNSNGNVITVTAPEGYSFITASYVLGTAANHVAINGTDCSETDNTYTFEDKATSFELTSVNSNSNKNSDVVSMTFVLAAIGDTTSLSEIETVEAEAVYYDLMGRRVENPAGGLYIRKQGSTVTKVIVK